MKKFSLNPSKLILRHPMLYYIRYIILSKNNSGECSEDIGCFNDINHLEDIPKLYFEVNAKINVNPEADELERALSIARYLRTNIKGGAGLGLSSEKTLEKMLSGKGGVCSDFAQIFNIFCFINGIKVKEWGCVDRFYKTRFGHSFNEIYSSKLQQWIAIDIQKAIVFRAADNSLLSTVALFNSLRNGFELQYEYISAYVPDKIYRIPYIYSRNAIPFVIGNYRNNVNDHFFVKFKKWPPFMINVLMVLSRKNHDFIFVMDNYKQKLLPKPMQNLRLISFF